MIYSEALTYLDSFVNYERSVPGHLMRQMSTLDRVRELAERLGNPQNKFPTIHVAGTKGKGSTCAFAAAILSAAGFKTGLYISPHLQNIRERISIFEPRLLQEKVGQTSEGVGQTFLSAPAAGGRDAHPPLIPLAHNMGQWICEADFARLLDACRPVLELMRGGPEGERPPTYFEIMTHLAFTWFAEQQVDVAVIEVGLGGRLDATNIITPIASGITNISFDHMAILGDTLEEIAAEKAGIIKAGIPVISAPQLPGVARVLEERARMNQTRCEFVGRTILTGRQKCLPHHLLSPVLLKGCREEKLPVVGEFSLSTLPTMDSIEAQVLPLPKATIQLPDGTRYDAEIGLRGQHQIENWAVAVSLSDVFHLAKTGRHLPAAAVQSGSKNVCWPGRLEIVTAPVDIGPQIILDGAHNDHSLKTVLNALLPSPLGERADVSVSERGVRGAVGHAPEKDENLTILFACAKDKDIDSMLKVLSSFPARVVFTHSGNSRGKDPFELAREWLSHSRHPAPAYSSHVEGLEAAKRLAGPRGIVLVTGSLYLVGAIRDWLQNTSGATGGPSIKPD